MKKGLLATTALICAGVLSGGTAVAAEAPEWKLGGIMNFQVYWADQDYQTDYQDHGWYFGVDESELAINVSGAADNGLKYGFKIEINANTDDDSGVAQEARIQLSGDWGTVQMGDEDGAEDIMNYGGENLIGGGSGFDGDFGDIYIKADGDAPRGPTIAGDSGDSTKISYFSPRFSGFQVGASLTPTPGMMGDDFKKDDDDWENHYGIGANYDNTFGSVRVRASAVYSASSSLNAGTEDNGAYSVGGIVGFGGFSIGANWTDNGESGGDVGDSEESSYWNVAGQFVTGPIKLSAGYFAGVYSETGDLDDEFTNIALSADYTAAPGLGFYAGINLIEEDDGDSTNDNDATILILGAKVSF